MWVSEYKAAQNSQNHQMTEEFPLLEEAMPPSWELTRSGNISSASRPRRSSKKQLPLTQYHKKNKFGKLIQKLTPIPFSPPGSLNVQMHQALLNRLGLWEFVNLKLDVPTHPHLIAELIVTYNHTKHSSEVCGKRIALTRAKLASALKLRVRKKSSLVSEDVSFSAISISFMEEFVCNWILLHDDIWIMPPEVVEVTRLVREGQILKVDWARILWLMVEKEILQGKNLVHCHYASHLMCLMKSQFELLFSDGGDLMKSHFESLFPGTIGDGVGDVNSDTLGEEGVIPSGEDEEEDTCEKDRDVVVIGADSEERSEHDNDREDTRGGPRMEADGFFRQILPNFGNGSAENEDIGRCFHFRDVDKHEEHLLRRCDDVESGGVGVEEGNGDETKETEIGDDDPIENSPVRGIVTCTTPMGGPSPVSSMFAINISESVEKEDSRHPSRPIFDEEFFGADLSVSLGAERRKRLREEDDMGVGGMAYDVEETYFENIQMYLRRWRSASESKRREIKDVTMRHDCLLRELHHRDMVMGKLIRDKDGELQRKQMEVDQLVCELRRIEHVLVGYKEALYKSRMAFEEYMLQNPLSVEPIYRDVEGGNGLVLLAVELDRMEAEKAEEDENRMMVSVGKMVTEMEEKWVCIMDGYLQKVEALGSTLEERRRDVCDIKQLFVLSKAAKQQQECSRIV